MDKTKHFKFDSIEYNKDMPELEVEEIDGVLHQDNLENILEKLRGKILHHYWMPIKSIYYEKKGEGHYEHFCQENCFDMFNKRAEEIKKGIKEGRISNVAIYDTEFNIKVKHINPELEGADFHIYPD